MSNSTGPIACSVILSLIFIHGGVVAARLETTNEGFATQEQSPSAIGQERAPRNPIQLSYEQQLARALDRDDINIDLDKITDAHRYDTIGESRLFDYSNNNNEDASKLENIIYTKLLPTNRYVKNQYSLGKRLNYKPNISLAKEDKDYTFVALAPTNKDNNLHRNQEFASRASLWASEVLPGWLDQMQNRLRNLERLSTTNSRQGVGANSADHLAPVERQKRRRCKMDPNLGVKNPTFCDTDAYFGAADYSMRDVWDSAGR